MSDARDPERARETWSAYTDPMTEDAVGAEGRVAEPGCDARLVQSQEGGSCPEDPAAGRHKRSDLRRMTGSTTSKRENGNARYAACRGAG